MLPVCRFESSPSLFVLSSFQAFLSQLMRLRITREVSYPFFHPQLRYMYFVYSTFITGIREFKKLLRRRQRERRKTIGFNEKSNGSVCALLSLVHFACRNPQQNNNVEWPNLKFCEVRKHTSVNFSFSVLT